MAAFVNAATTDDNYIAGYAAGVLKHALKLDVQSVDVRNGIITLQAGSMMAVERDKAVRLLAEIPGVKGVKITQAAVPSEVFPEVEYYNGYSPSGQFYNNKVEYVGLGAHYFF
ncbi:DUF1207 domain-containing protein [Methylomarinum sp. Ch1-1]|uniref:DUF1207 domain-containing protein n=1 Tax=Methylomarinum roseum TaxID=3067653 RepID=A0AAU7NTC2_9GAMM|nr:DUF1207 domain-containing protein [Methylomarinum sp. Ch1-1]MDP4519700.1 DUF1207 domain-containing protein [Methylomarinum sp. Ch1-1]